MSDIAYTAILPEGWPRPRGFAHAVRSVGTRTIRVAGQVAQQAGAPVAAGLDIGGQWQQALANVVTVVRAAGGDIANIVSLRAYVTDIEAFRQSGAAIGAAWAATLGRHFPAMTLVEVTGLVDRNAVVEIEAEAVLP
ncbi:MAG: RidA family protein [Alphaproteobacteria bacterium]|nr:RidA family protein [Alphaproteobacteria bacterium]